MNTISLSQRRTPLALERVRHLEEAGDYQAAIKEMADVWSGPGTEPDLTDLDDLGAGEVLLRAGILSGVIGSAGQVAGSQETAKNLLSRAEQEFATAGDRNKVSEARAALAVCYWRSGSLDEARALLKDALLASPVLNPDSILRLLVTLAIVEWQSGKVSLSLEIFAECKGLSQQTASAYLVGTYHVNHGLALKTAGHVDLALEELNAAEFCFAEAGHVRYQASVQNNVAMILLSLDRLAEAHDKLDHAAELFRQIGDTGNGAQVNDTRARVFLAQREYAQAEAAATAAVDVLSGGDEKSVLVDSLVTRAIALARLPRTAEALRCFSNAWEIAHQSVSELRAAEVAVLVVEELTGPAFVDCGIEYEAAMKRIGSRLIKEALERSSGRVTDASLRLGMTHQALSWMLSNSHKHLQGSRLPMQPRKKSLIKKKLAKVVRMRRASS